MNTKEKIAVMQASMDGKEIEYTHNDHAGHPVGWKPIDAPSWDWAACVYRVKPREPRRMYARYDVGGSMQSIRECREETEKLVARHGGELIEFVEVIKENK